MIGNYDLRLTSSQILLTCHTYQRKLLPVISRKLTFGPLNGVGVVFVKFERASRFAVLFEKAVEIKNNRRNADP